jgi:hypothetical protein
VGDCSEETAPARKRQAKRHGTSNSRSDPRGYSRSSCSQLQVGNQPFGLAQVRQRVGAKPGHVARIDVDAEKVLSVGLGDLSEEAWGLEEREVGHFAFSRWGQSEPGRLRNGKLGRQRPNGTPGKTAWDFKFKVCPS